LASKALQATQTFVQVNTHLKPFRNTLLCHHCKLNFLFSYVKAFRRVIKHSNEDVYIEKVTAKIFKVLYFAHALTSGLAIALSSRLLQADKL